MFQIESAVSLQSFQGIEDSDYGQAVPSNDAISLLSFSCCMISPVTKRRKGTQAFPRGCLRASASRSDDTELPPKPK